MDKQKECCFYASLDSQEPSRPNSNDKRGSHNNDKKEDEEEEEPPEYKHAKVKRRQVIN